MAIIENKDLPAYFKEYSVLAQKIAESTFVQVFNIAAKEFNSRNKSLTYSDSLSYLGTLFSHFAARWISEMIHISQQDDAGYDKDELIKEIFNGIIAILGGEIEFSQNDDTLPHGIKRLKNKGTNR